MTSAVVPPRRPHVGRSFYLVMSLVLAGIVLVGFSHTAPGDLAATGFPAILWLHAGVFGAWVLLFMVQPALALRGSLALHRRLGWLGLALGCGMVALGSAAVLLALWAGTVPPFYPHAFFLVRGLVGLALFAALMGAGIAKRRRADWHKRLMLCASIPFAGCASAPGRGQGSMKPPIRKPIGRSLLAGRDPVPQCGVRFEATFGAVRGGVTASDAPS